MRRTIGYLVVALIIFVLAISKASATPISTTLWVGVEDLRLPGGDKDRQDMIIRISGPSLSIIGSGAWQPMQTPNQDGTPFWDNTSADGSGGWNVGYFVTGTGNFTGNPNSPALPVSQLQYWGVGTNPDPNFRFFSTGGVTTEILTEVSAYSGSNALYWFPASSPSSLNLIFSGSAGVGTLVSFNTGGVDFGLRLLSPDGDYRTTGGGAQFAVFSQVPEPTSISLVLLGGFLFIIGGIRHRRQNHRKG